MGRLIFMEKKEERSRGEHRLTAITLRQPREIVVRRRSVPLSRLNEVSLVDTCQRGRQNDYRVTNESAVTQHGVQEEGVVNEERERKRERERKPVTLDLYTRWKVDGISESVERRRSATKLAKGEQGPETSTLFLPLDTPRQPPFCTPRREQCNEV